MKSGVSRVVLTLGIALIPTALLISTLTDRSFTGALATCLISAAAVIGTVVVLGKSRAR